MKAHRQDSGFALVDVLIALSIVGMVTVTLVSVFSYAQDASASVQADKAYLDDISLLHRVLVDAFAETKTSDGLLAGLSGDDATLTVLTAAPRLLPFLDAPVRLTLRPDSEGAGLHATWSSEGNRAPVVAHRIVSTAYRVRFGYLSPQTGWAPSWSDRSRVPSTIQVELRSARDGARRIDLALSVRETKSALCAVQPSLKPCRAVW